MTVGEKLRTLRKKRGLTQSALAGETLTRNMLSQIERGAALPSYGTVSYLSKRLSVDPGYFFDGSHDLLYYEMQSALPAIKRVFAEGKYDECLDLCRPFDALCDPLLFEFSSFCHFYLGVLCYQNGDFTAASSHFDACEVYLKPLSIVPFFADRISFYKTLIDAFFSPNGERSVSVLSSLPRDEYTDYVIYLLLDSLIDRNQTERATVIYNTVGIKNELLRSHFNARIAASLYNYDRAKKLLRSVISSGKGTFPFLYRVLNDLERYCKATDDYEGAYHCLLEKQKYDLIKK